MSLQICSANLVKRIDKGSLRSREVGSALQWYVVDLMKVHPLNVSIWCECYEDSRRHLGQQNSVVPKELVGVLRVVPQDLRFSNVQGTQRNSCHFSSKGLYNCLLLKSDGRVPSWQVWFGRLALTNLANSQLKLSQSDPGGLVGLDI